MRHSLALMGMMLIAGVTHAEPLGLGRPAGPAEIASSDIDIRADGAGLPPGRGSVKDGEALFASRCAACHGERGEQPMIPPLRLAGGRGTLAKPAAVLTVGSYWPYATTLFDYVRRAMPFNAPQSLTDDDVYAATAYVLYLNGIVSADAVLGPDNLASIVMPNRNGFVRNPDLDQ